MITILIVDDSATLRELLAELLKKKGINVIEAVDGKDAQQKLDEVVPNLIITDLIMPQMNGYELCRWIKNEPQLQQIPVIILSTKGEDFDKYWGLKQGADAYLTKPYQSKDLLKTVKMLLKNAQG